MWIKIIWWGATFIKTTGQADLDLKVIHLNSTTSKAFPTSYSTNIWINIIFLCKFSQFLASETVMARYSRNNSLFPQLPSGLLTSAQWIFFFFSTPNSLEISEGFKSELFFTTGSSSDPPLLLFKPFLCGSVSLLSVIIPPKASLLVQLWDRLFCDMMQNSQSIQQLQSGPRIPVVVKQLPKNYISINMCHNWYEVLLLKVPTFTILKISLRHACLLLLKPTSSTDVFRAHYSKRSGLCLIFKSILLLLHSLWIPNTFFWHNSHASKITPISFWL